MDVIAFSVGDKKYEESIAFLSMPEFDGQKCDFWHVAFRQKSHFCLKKHGSHREPCPKNQNGVVDLVAVSRN
jgi:hypothetical protein